MSSRSIGVVLFGLALGCVRQTPGANPHDMSAAQHEAMARQEHAEAEAHSARYDPNAATDRSGCRAGGPAGATSGDVCWTQPKNPTREHLEHAEQHRRRAADHRAASQALRDAEARACVGIRDADRDATPFDHRDDIESVERLYSLPSGGKNSTRRFEGATVTFRAVPGLTAQWLQRVIDCHLARNAALGNDVPEMGYCPLVPKGVAASVTPTQTGFAVAIRAGDTETADEIWRRAQALGPRRP